MQTRGNRLNYLALNDGYQSEGTPQDWTYSPTRSPAAQDPGELGLPSLPRSPGQSTVSPSINCHLESLKNEASPSGSASQLPTTATGFQNSHFKPLKNDWLWGHLRTREFPHEWIEKRNRKKRHIDREICCTAIDKDTGKQCSWSTTDSKRQSSTTNIRHHLKEKHGILPQGVPETASVPQKTTLVSLWGNKEKLTIQELLEKNLLRWVISNKQSFTVLESPEFQQIFKDLPETSLTFISRHTLRL